MAMLNNQRVTVKLRANTSICPRLLAAIFVCAENVVKMEVFCIMAKFMLYIGTHSIGTCASLLHIIIIIIIIIVIVIIIIIIIKPLLKIFNECRSLTGVGELNPYWRSSMNIKFNGDGEIYIFPKYPCWSSQLNVKSNVWYPQVYSIEGVWANRGVCA